MEIRFSPWKRAPFICLELRVEKRGKRKHHMGLSFLPLFSRLFWRVSLSILNYSSKFHIMAADVGLGPSGPNCILVPIDGPRSLLLVSYYRKSLGLTFSLGSQNQIRSFGLDLILAEKMGLYNLFSFFHLTSFLDASPPDIFPSSSSLFFGAHL